MIARASSSPDDHRNMPALCRMNCGKPMQGQLSPELVGSNTSTSCHLPRLRAPSKTDARAISLAFSNALSMLQSYEFKSSLTSSRSSFSKTSKPSRSARSEVRRSSCESCHASGAIGKDVRQLSRCTSSSRAWRSRSRSSGVKSANFIFRIGLRFGEKGVARDYARARGFRRADSDTPIPKGAQGAANLGRREAVEDCRQAGEIPIARPLDRGVKLHFDY